MGVQQHPHPPPPFLAITWAVDLQVQPLVKRELFFSTTTRTTALPFRFRASSHSHTNTTPHAEASWRRRRRIFVLLFFLPPVPMHMPPTPSV